MFPIVLLLSIAQSPAPVCDPPPASEHILLAADIPMDIRFSSAAHTRKIEQILAKIQPTTYDRALALYGKQTLSSRDLLNQILTDNPNHGPSLLLRARIAASSSFRDLDRVKADIAQFHRACPNSFVSVSELARLPDLAWLASETAILRNQLKGRAGRLEAIAYPVLWQYELIGRRSDQQEDTRRIWQEDMEHLRNDRFPRTLSWLGAIQAMEFHLNKQFDWLSADFGRFHPHSYIANLADLMATRELGNASQAVARFEQLTKLYPASPGIASYRISFSREKPDLLPDAYIAMKSAMDLDPDSYKTLPPYQITMAEDLVRRKLRMDLVPTFIFAGIEVIHRETTKDNFTDLYAESEKFRRQRYDFWYLLAYLPLIEAYTALDKPAEALDLVAQTQTILNRSRPSSTASLKDRNRHLSIEANFWRVKGLLASSRGKKFDALIAYRNALASFPPASVNPDKRDEVMAEALKISKEFGATAETWNDWEAKQPLSNLRSGVGKTNAWQALLISQPDLNIKDMLGREFTPAQLKQKKTFVNLWATWCLPCRAELPYLEKLAIQVKDREDIAVIALNVDEDTTLVEPFLKSFNFHFPANLAQAYAYAILPAFGIPANYLIRGETTSYFDSQAEGDAWVAAALKAVNQP